MGYTETRTLIARTQIARTQITQTQITQTQMDAEPAGGIETSFPPNQLSRVLLQPRDAP